MLRESIISVLSNPTGVRGDYYSHNKPNSQANNKPPAKRIKAKIPIRNEYGNVMHLRIITLSKTGLLVAQSSSQVQPVFPIAVVHNTQVNFSKRHIADTQENRFLAISGRTSEVHHPSRPSSDVNRQCDNPPLGSHIFCRGKLRLCSLRRP